MWLAKTQIAWTRPGIYPSRVNRMLIQKCEPNPTLKKTPSGGMITERMTRSRSAMVYYRNVRGLDVLKGCLFRVYGRNAPRDALIGEVSWIRAT